MNKIWKQLTGGTIKAEPRKRKERKTWTVAITESRECIGTIEGIKTFDDFPAEAQLLNVMHKNGKTTVIKKEE